jgi:hypothetical protein
LGGILRSLQSRDQVGWEDQIELGSECLFEIHQMARPLYQGYKADRSHGLPALVPIHQKASRAIPHVKTMMRAIRRKDQATAIESGRAALAEM